MDRELLKKRIDAAVEELGDELVEFAQGFFRIPTQNPPGNNYWECVRYVGRMMEKLGMRVEYVEVPEDRLAELAPHGEGLPRISVIGTYPGAEARPNIHFTGHYDVVPEGDGWSYPPYGAEIHDGKIYARGSSDQKSGVVSELFALYALQKAGIKLRGTYIASTTPDEETGGQAGVGYLVEQGYLNKDNTDYCVVTECLNVDNICIGHRGTLWFEIQLTGKQCHGAMPAEGINAAEHMRLLLNAIDEKIQTLPEMNRVSELPIDPPTSRRTTLANTYVHVGEKVNTVPGFARVGFDWRITPEYTVEWAKEKLFGVLEELKATVPDFKYEYVEFGRMDPTLVPKDTPVVKAFQQAGKDYLGSVPEFSLSPGMDDQRYIVHQGGLEQCIVYGPGPLYIAHKADEFVPIEDMKTSAKIMALAACDLLGVVD